MKTAVRKLDPKDVSCGIDGSASSAGGSFDRSTQVRSYRMRMTHTPTGAMVESEYGPARMTKGQWKDKKREMHESLMAELADVVSRSRKATRPGS